MESHNQQTTFQSDLAANTVPAEKQLGILDVDVTEEALDRIKLLEAELAEMQAKYLRLKSMVADLFRNSTKEGL